MKSHSRSSTQSITAMSLAAIALAALALTLTACGGHGDEAADTHDHADGDADHSHDDDAPAGDSSSDANDAGGEEEYSQVTPESFQQLKDMWLPQVEGLRASAETLRQVEAEHNDQQLKDLIAQLDAKVAEAQTMLDESTVANGSKTLQVDLPQVVGQAGELITRANERMTEVLQERFGGGSGDDQNR